jgi:copper chaperone
MDQQTYQVTGMTCSHCVDAVTREVVGVPGVSAVHVDLETGTVLVEGRDVSDEEVRAAVDEAGYAVS